MKHQRLQEHVAFYSDVPPVCEWFIDYRQILSESKSSFQAAGCCSLIYCHQHIELVFFSHYDSFFTSLFSAQAQH